MSGDTAEVTSWPPTILGLAELGHRAFRGEDLGALRAALESRVGSDPADAAAWLDLGIIHEYSFRPEEGRACQAQALRHERVFRAPAGNGAEGLRLLMFVAPGEIITNVPVSFLLHGSDVTLNLVFLTPDETLPDRLPEHDVAMVGVCESEANLPYLAQLDALLPGWPRPVLLDPAGIRAMERDSLWRLLDGAPGIFMPPTFSLSRGQVRNLALGATPEHADLALAARAPFLLRPVDSHGGHGLERIEASSDIAEYLNRNAAETFFLSPFIDYRGPDGLYRKYRVALVDGQPFLCHMALAEQWMLHYVNAGMYEDADKRRAESEAFSCFDSTFAMRHAAALKALHERVGLEYIIIDCAETADGALLVFEAGTAMVVHDMDSAEVYPYKAPNMRRIFEAFRAMLQRRACAYVSGADERSPQSTGT